MSIMWVRRIASWVLIGIAIWLFWPIPGPDDILNLTLGGWISATFGCSYAAGVLATYTVLPIAILWLGCFISPKPTQAAFMGVLGKIRAVCVRIVSDPRLLVAAIAMFAILYYVYIIYISKMIVGG